VHPRFRTRRLLPCLLTLLLVVVPAHAWADPGVAMLSSPSTCPGITPGGMTLATDTTNVAAGWQPADVNVSLTGTGVAGWEWMIDCGTPVPGPPGSTVLFNVSGQHILSHRAQDSNGIWTDWVDDTIQIDKTVPVNNSTVPAGWSRTPVNVTIAGADSVSGIDHVEYDLDGAGAQSVPSGTSFNVTGDGTHTLDTVVEDYAGNRSTPRSDTIQIDTVAPVDTTVVPSTWQYTPTTINITATDALSGIGHVEWRLDGAPVGGSSGANGASVVIPDGTHSLETRVVDVAGNGTGWVGHTVMVDTTGPQDTTAVPTLWQASSPVDITVSGIDPQGSGIDHVNWKLDGVPGTGPNNSHVSVSGDGVHTLETQVVDGGGEVSGWNTRSVRIDTVTPTDQTSTATGWFTTAQTVPVTGYDAHSGVQKVEWKLDSAGTQSSTGNPANVLVSGDGNHTLVTRIYDNAGHVSGYKTNTIRIDGSAPVNTTPPASSAWRRTQYSVVLSGADSVSGMSEMTYTVDGGPPTTGPSGIQTAIVSGAGTHTLRTWATDVAGNMSGFRDETINIDDVAPSDTTSGPSGAVANNYPITLTGSDAHSGIDVIKYTLDGGDEHSLAPGSPVTISGAGPHTLATQAVDNAGNTSGWKTMTVTVDLTLSGDITPPADTTTTVGAGWQTHDVVLTLNANDGAGVGVDHMEYRIGGINIQRAAVGSTVTITGDGSHTIETRAYDLLGNVSTWREQTVDIDTVVPVDTSALTPAPGWTNSRTVTLSGTDAPPGSGLDKIEYQVDGGPSQFVADNGTVTLPSDGDHTIRHRALDVAGQASGFTRTSLKVDSVNPVNTSAAAPTAWQTASGVSLPLTGTDALSSVDHYEWRVDGGATHTGSPALVDADGVQLLETQVVDKAGNPSGWRPETVKIDRTKPSNTTAVPAGGWQNTNFTTVVSGTDATSGVAGVEWKLDGGATQTTTAVSITASGAHTLSSRIRDGAGNWSVWRDDSVGIDKVAPTLSASCGTAEWRSSPAVCSVSADGGASGLSVLTGARGDAAPAAVSGGSFVVDSEGSYPLTFRAVDGAGNEKLALAQVKVDLTPPSAGVSCAADTGTGYVCTATGGDALSGLAGLTWSVDGSGGTGVGSGATFSVAKGTVTVTASDRAGNAGTSPRVTLAERKSGSTATTPPKKPTKPGPTPRTASRAVLRRGKGTVAARALGQLEISALPESTTATLRPLALGKGSFQVSLKVTADRKSKSVVKKVSSKAGYSPQIVVKVGGAVDVTVKLTVKRKSGGRWTTYATGTTKL
jgi:hypothetical protein